MPEVKRKASGEHKQSVVFNKEVGWSRASSRKWCQEHDFYVDGYEPTINTHRWRQYDPDDKKFRYRNTIVEEQQGTWSIFFVMGYPHGSVVRKGGGKSGNSPHGDQPKGELMVYAREAPLDCWLLEPRTLETLLDRANRVEIAALRLKQAAAAINYRRQQGAAVIPIQGIISLQSTLLGQIFGSEITHEQLRQALNDALHDSAVDAIVLDFDSPGGSAHGLQGLADALRDADQRKPVYAYSEALMASAAYFLGSQARQILVSPEAAVGGIGSEIILPDFSEAFRQKGVKVEVFASGPLKSAGIKGTTLTDEQRQYIQQIVDDTARVFKDVVAARRGFSADEMNELARGNVMIGQRAVTAGLADEVITLDKWLLRRGTTGTT